MELFERVELAMWALRRTIERARYIEIQTAELERETTRRLREMRRSLQQMQAHQGLRAPSSPKPRE